MTTTKINNFTDVIDSRDVIDALDEFRNRHINGETLTPDEAEYEASLRKLVSEGQGFEDWNYGIPLIRDAFFREYAMDLAYECGMVPDNLDWPLSCIDWDQAARELQMDYTPIEFDGVTYWTR